MMIVEGGMFSFPIPSPNSPEVFSATSLSFRTRFLFTPLLVSVTRLVGDGCALAIANGEGSELLVGAPAGGSAGTPAGGSAGAPAGGSATLLAGELWGVVVGVGGIEVAGLEGSDQRAGSMSDMSNTGDGRPLVALLDGEPVDDTSDEPIGRGHWGVSGIVEWVAEDGSEGIVV